MAWKDEKKDLVIWDWLIIGVYFAICLGLGIYVSKYNFIIVYINLHLKFLSHIRQCYQRVCNN